MIILEGPDNSGKSTLAEKLAEDLSYLHEYPFKVQHSPGPLDRRSGMVRWLLEEIAKAPQPLIYDRISVISDVVYSPIVRGEPSFYITSNVKQYVDGIIKLNPHIIIYCRPSIEKIMEDNGRDQMDGVYENHYSIIKSYDNYIEEYVNAGYHVVNYNHELGDNHYQEILRKVIGYYQEMMKNESNQKRMRKGKTL